VQEHVHGHADRTQKCSLRGIGALARISLIAAVVTSSVTMSGQPAAALTSTLRPDGDVLRQWTARPRRRGQRWMIQ
jgi:hypothetical protein